MPLRSSNIRADWKYGNCQLLKDSLNRTAGRETKLVGMEKRTGSEKWEATLVGNSFNKFCYENNVAEAGKRHKIKSREIDRGRDRKR